MKNMLAIVMLTCVLPCVVSAETPPVAKQEAIPWSEIGAKADAQYAGDGLSIVVRDGKIVLKSMLQRLEGEATEEGLWMTSVSETEGGGRFRIRAEAVGRESDLRNLAVRGTVAAAQELVRWVRPVLVEEYSTGSDGIRQDFIVLVKPAGKGDLRVGLSVSGARVEAAGAAIRVIVEGSGRAISYGRLRVTDANGKDLTARMEADSPSTLGVVVADADAVYPLRIDPTFSDWDWISMGGFRGANGMINAMVVDGAGNLYVGGDSDFTAIGNLPVNSVAKWNGSEWSSLGKGVYGEVTALAVSGTDLYVGGSIYSAGGVSLDKNLVKWNGSVWSDMGLEVQGGPPWYDVPVISAVAIVGNSIYVGGDFDIANSSAANNIVRWNGSTWSPMGSGALVAGTDFGRVQALAVSGTDLFVGGHFDVVDGVAANNIAKWNGSKWSSLGEGISQSELGEGKEVCALAVAGPILYVGGTFDTAGSIPASSIAMWNAGTWSSLGTGVGRSTEKSMFSPTVISLLISGTDVYVGGIFETAGGINAVNIAKWNGSTWSPLGTADALYNERDYTAEYRPASALAFAGGDLYVGGWFVKAGDVPVSNLAKWSKNTWTLAVEGSGLSDTVMDLAFCGTELYVGGWFKYIGGTPFNYIAKWNGSAWSQVGSGLSGHVSELEVSGSNLYAAGNVNGGFYENVAKWDGASWSILGGGMEMGINALSVSNTKLYVGGNFRTAGGVRVDGIAEWTGNAWVPLGTGMSNSSGFGSVEGLALSGSNLYASGFFNSAGGVSANNIAMWNGTVWSPLGSGCNSAVGPILFVGSKLYAGGNFTTAGGYPANHIAKWDGITWSPLGSGVDGEVKALANAGELLYVCGNFNNAGGISASRISKWNGSGWSALGSGMDSPVYTIAVLGSQLYAGGSFSKAGNKISAFLARADLSGFAPEIAVAGNDTNIIDGDTTPATADHTDFGGVAQGGAVVSRTFTVRNTGTENLTLGIPSVPAGFTLTEGLSTPITPGATDTFTVRLDSVTAGTKSGQISFATNDADRNPFNFSIIGVVATPSASYAVTYSGNNASSGTAPAPQSKIHGTTLTLSGNSGSLAKTGYTFAGWNTAANGSGTDYAAGGSYTANAAVTLYAKWTANTCAVTYNANGATSGTVPASQTKTNGVTLTLRTNSGNLAKTGNSFAGWNTAANGSGTNYAAGGSYTANAAVTLYAKWTPTVAGWDGGYTDLGGGWRRLTWFGDYAPMGGAGWIWHNKHGFLYVPASSTPQNVWMYAQDMGWLYTGNALYPFLYRASPPAWLWYNGARNPRWFRNMTTGQWESRP